MASNQTENTFNVTFSGFNVGQAPLAHLDTLSGVGSSGHYTAATNVDVISKPGILTQGPGLTNLTDGTESGAITELVNYIMDVPTATNVTYGIAATKLHKISATAVTNSGGVFPRTITSATAGSSVAHFQGALYYFYNKASGGDCGKYDLSSSFDDDYMSTVPTGAAALQNAPHPVATKEDVMLFGNGRYVGVFFSATTTVDVDKLDFGSGTEVADICFDANQWWIAVNSGVTSGTNRTKSQIYLYDGGAISAQLADEVAVGVQKIGFIYPINGVKYVAYQDVSGILAIGYISGRSLKPLRYFTGTLPTFAQKTLYKNTILFISNGLVYSCGAVIEQLPVQISQLADAGYETVGALAAPFGTPLIASSQSTSYKLAQFNNYDTACSWKSIVIPTTNGKLKGMIDDVVVMTNTLGSSASCTITLEVNQASSNSAVKTITTEGKRRHVFRNFAIKDIEDFRVALSWSGGSTGNNVQIRSIQVNGHWVEAN